MKGPDGVELYDPLDLIGKTNTATIRAKCPLCSKDNNMVVSGQDLVKWQQGAFIQDAFPQLNASQREFLLTGTCPDGICFDEAFKDLDEDEDGDE